METNNITKTGYLTETTVSKSKNGKSKSYTYSTVIPKVIVNKFGLNKGHKLYWDIKDLSIIITPELPEDKSIQAGYDIFNDMLLNGKTDKYIEAFNIIKTELKETAENESKNEKINGLISEYNLIQTPEDKEGFKKVVLYLLDYPLHLPYQYEILQKVYKEITKTE